MLMYKTLWIKFSPPLFIIMGILIIGTIGYMVIEDWSFFEGFYMTVITIATVGFTEIRELSQSGRLFTIFVIISGIFAGGYAIGNLTSFLIGGEARRIYMEAVLDKRLSKLKNHVILLGYGKFGRAAADEVSRKMIPLVIIEHSEARIKLAQAEGFEAIQGDATDESLMIKIGIKHARGLVSAVSVEADNVLAVLTARVLNPQLVIVSRGDEEGSERKLLRAGADRVVLPYKIGGRRMAAIVVQPTIVDFLDVMFSGDELALELQEITVHKKSKLTGKTLSESLIRDQTGGALIVGIKSASGTIITNPRGTIVLREGDVLIALGSDNHLQTLKDLAG